MMSSSDLPACPACGARKVRAVQRMPEPGDPPGKTMTTLYGCAQCGRDRTDAWEAVQPPPLSASPIGTPGHANEDIDEAGQSETIAQAAHRLGIAATVKGAGK